MNALDYKDVSLVSRQVSSITSRDTIDTSVEFCGRKLSIPIVASPMFDVCDGHVAKIMMDNGAFGIIHRFSSISQQVADYHIAHGAGCAIGINGDCFERFHALYAAGCRIFCLDIASCASKSVVSVLDKIYSHDQNIYVIIGNTVSYQGFNFVAKHPSVAACRVGVAGGAGCTTKNATGIYHPMISLIAETYKERTDVVSIIADGGIKEPGDFCKALAFGADVIMMGSLIANTLESPAVKIFHNGKAYTEFRGSASFEIQSSYRVPRYIEGKRVLVEYHSEKLPELLNRFMDGLRSSMSYFDSKTIPEYRAKMNYVTIN